MSKSDQPDGLRAALADRYRIERELGSGGMATVYLAEDLKHHRRVAVKVLRPELAAVLGGERFLKEIEVTASLQHPSILALYDSGEADSFLYYVMPYIEGESLREKLNREKQLSIEETIAITKSVAAALQYAHERAVIHRDIKPENILLHSGQALVADFGIALAVTHAGGTRLTETGLSLGTPEYMSPEQAAGDRELDARSDVYSLGCVVYEMLVGDAPHTGSTVQAIVAKVLSEQPTPIERSRPTVPVNVRAAVWRALAKTPADRFPSPTQFVEALTNPAFRLPTGMDVVVSSSSAHWKQRLALPLAAVAVLLGALALWGWLREAPAGAVSRFRLELASTVPLEAASGTSIAVSPDGSRFVYVGDGPRLYVRSMDQLTETLIPGTDGAYNPIFSPDGEWVAFGTDGAIKKVALAGGPPVTIFETPGLVGGGSWGADDRLLFPSPTGPGLVTIPASGGTPRIVVAPDAESGESYLTPDLLPGEGWVVFAISGPVVDSARLAVASLETGEVKILPLAGASPRYVRGGHLVFVRGDGSMHAAPFDLRRVAVTGSAMPVVENVRLKGGMVAEYAVSPSGTLVYMPATGGVRNLVLVDRTGLSRPLTDVARAFYGPRFSPDGRRVAVTVFEGGTRDVWLYDIQSGTSTRHTFEADNLYPVWAPDGQRIAFSSSRSGSFDLFVSTAEASGSAERLYAAAEHQYTGSWSPDGRWMFFTESSVGTGRDIWVLPVGENAAPRPVLNAPHEERSPMISPDGRWLAYASNESGRLEVYVRAFPGPGGKWQVSFEGGEEPLWAGSGRELFYRSGNRIMSAAVETDPVFVVRSRSVVFEQPYVPNAFHTNYDLHPNGRDFVMVESVDSRTEVVVVLNWIHELRELGSR